MKAHRAVAIVLVMLVLASRSTAEIRPHTNADSSVSAADQRILGNGNGALLIGAVPIRVNAAIVTDPLKGMDRRLGPADVSPNGDFFETWFGSSIRRIGRIGGFPSGHGRRRRAAAFPGGVADDMAGVIGWSRLNAHPHFPSDIFPGDYLGYSISHFVVLRR